jgi:Arc/MetJ family transcription regulator
MFTHQEAQVVRTNIEIDDDLMRQAMRRSGAATKKAAVEEALQLLVKTHEQTSIRRWRGKVQWEGNLKQLRRSRVPQ